MRNHLSGLVFVAVLAIVWAPSAYADKTHEGLVVKAADGKLTMSDRDGGKRHTHDVAADAKITCDGKGCKLSDLLEGFCVTVTTRDNSNAAIRIDAKSEETHEGKLVKAADGSLTMTDKNGNNMHTHKVAFDAKITCDGKACRLDELREGYLLTVTTRANVVMRIEAKTKK
jgi:hypothetical protein